MRDGRTYLSTVIQISPGVVIENSPTPLVNPNNDNYACGRLWAGRLRPVQVPVVAR